MGVLRRLAAVGAAGGASACLAAAYYYRPLPDWEVRRRPSKGVPHQGGDAVGDQAGGARGGSSGGGGEIFGTNARGLDLRDGEPLALVASRAITMFLGAGVCKFVIGGLNKTVVEEGREGERLWEAVRSREAAVPLITVANHESTFDDPGMMGAIVPWDTVWDPRRMRWGICTQEICFPDTFRQVLMGAGQALPIRRGGGIQQPLLLDVARHVAAGHWVHVFPEGRVVQSGQLGLDPLTPRSEGELQAKGRLKWGVGRLVAHAPRVPIVIPMHHRGMPGVLPQHNEWREGGGGGRVWDNKMVSPVPRTGQRVTVRVGDAIEVGDLVAAHEREHGPLRKVSWRAGGWEGDWEWWRQEPSDAEKRLYSAIARRVQEGLLRLEDGAAGYEGAVGYEGR